MFIFDYIKKLTHRFGKNQIQKNCLSLQDILRTHTIPAYASAVDLFKLHNFKAKEVIAFSKTFNKFAGGSSNRFVETILDALKNSTVILDALYKKSEELYADQEATLGLTFEKISYLRLLGAISFTNDFSRKLLNYIFILETANADESFQLKGSLSPAEIATLESGFINFSIACGILNTPFEEIQSKLGDLPDAVYSESVEKTLQSTLGPSKIDPLGFRNFTVPFDISVKWANPFYWVGVVIADIQVASYKAAKEELSLIQLRKLNLEKIYAKTPDPRLQVQIEALTNRVAALNYSIEKLEEDSVY